MKHASDLLTDKREWFIPGTTKVAWHLSDVNQCLRKAAFKRDDLQRRFDEGDGPKALTAEEIVRFGRGYAMQDLFVGADVEEAVWDNEWLVFYSPDGGLLNPLEVKTTNSSRVVKKEREADWSLEDVLLRGPLRDTYYARAVHDWQRYMIGAMHLKGWNHYYLFVVWMLDEDAKAFKFSVTPEEIKRTWDEEIGPRLKILHHYDETGEEPSISTRISNSECESCPFLERCIDQLDAVGAFK